MVVVEGGVLYFGGAFATGVCGFADSCGEGFEHGDF